MTKFKGTQGKWEYVETEEHPLFDNEWHSVVQMPEYAISISLVKCISKLEAEANAKLIAAAPEILGALQHTLEVLYQCDPPKELFETYANAFSNYHNLIKKATE